jgi:hypothetical protein
MLEVGANNPVFNGAMLSHSEARAHFATWCVLSSPLVLGLDLTNETAMSWVWDTIANERAIAVNQMYVGDAGRMVLAHGKVHMGGLGQHAATMVFAKTIAKAAGQGKGAHQVAVVVLNNHGMPFSPDINANVSIPTKTLGINCGAGCTVTDVWSGKTVGGSGAAPVTATLTASGILPHDSVFQILTAPDGSAGIDDVGRSAHAHTHVRNKNDDTGSNAVVVDCAEGAVDCTAQLQVALSDPSTDHIVVPRRTSPWPSGPLMLNRSNVKLELAAGAIIQARRSAFVEPNSLLTVTGWVRGGDQNQTTTIRNISIVGAKGSALSMWRADYANTSLYTHSEDRMGLSITGVEDLLLEGFVVAETGGDGIYLRNIFGGHVRNVTTDGAYRNGMSIISASDLLVEDCVFARTGAVRDPVTGAVRAQYGTQPRAGVDIEPDAAHDLLANVTLRRVSAIENAGDAFDILACEGSATDCSSRPGRKVSVALEDCEARDCPYIWGSAFVIALNSALGSVTVTNASAENMPGAGLAVYASTPFGSGTSLVVHNLTMSSVATEWQRRLTGKGAVQSWYPVTIGAQGMMPNHIELNQVSVYEITAVEAGQTFVGCQNHSYDDNYFITASCGAVGRVGALTGDVTVWAAKNHSACSKALLGGAGDNLAVTCSTLLTSDAHMRLKGDDTDPPQIELDMRAPTPRWEKTIKMDDSDAEILNAETEELLQRFEDAQRHDTDSARVGGGGSCPNNCSLNGVCDNSGTAQAICICDGPWAGDDCGKVVTLPSPTKSVYGNGFGDTHPSNVTSWGGSLLYEGTQWHLYATQMRSGGMMSWASQSECVHAVATHPAGPFAFVCQDVAVPLWCHGPQVLRHEPSGEFLLLHVGDGDRGPPGPPEPPPAPTPALAPPQPSPPPQPAPSCLKSNNCPPAYGGACPSSKVPGYTCYPGVCGADSEPRMGSCGEPPSGDLAEPTVNCTRDDIAACALAAAAECDKNLGCGAFSLSEAWNYAQQTKLFSKNATRVPVDYWTSWYKDDALDAAAEPQLGDPDAALRANTVPESVVSGFMHHSKSPDGPWLPATGPSPMHGANNDVCNMPDAAFHPNGTLFVICGNGALMSRVLDRKANPWEAQWAPLVQLPPNDHAWAPQSGWEDPDLWFDRRGNFHILYHVYDMRNQSMERNDSSNLYSGHAFSADGIEWSYSKTEPYSGTVRFTDGTSKTYATRERPHVIFDPKKDPNSTTPVGIITAVSAQPVGPSCDACPSGACSQCKAVPGWDWAYTVFEPWHGFEERVGVGVKSDDGARQAIPTRSGSSRRAIPTPSAAQHRYQSTDFVALIHFNMGTYAANGDPSCNADNWDVQAPCRGSNCPVGKTRDPATFAPEKLNTSQWMESITALGSSIAILTAKHGVRCPGPQLSCVPVCPPLSSGVDLCICCCSAALRSGPQMRRCPTARSTPTKFRASMATSSGSS